jgi:methionyl-tRNA formyltransferase
MKIIFMGSPDFALPSLEKLYRSPQEISAIVTGKDKRRGRGSEMTPTAVKARATELQLPIIEVEDLQDPSFIRELEKLQPDLFVVVAFRILPQQILNIPTKGTINLHASLLPKYRGAAPIHWAVMNGETHTGCTVFWVTEKMDTGNIINQHSTFIGKNETTGEVYARLKEQGSNLLAQSVKEIVDGTVTSYKQNDEESTPAPKIFKDDCKVDFNKSALEIHNKIRGLSPLPGAWAELDDLKFNLYKSVIGPSKSVKPGSLHMHENDLLAGCKDGTVVLQTVQIEGKREMSGKEFMNGYHGTGQLY